MRADPLSTNEVRDRYVHNDKAYVDYDADAAEFDAWLRQVQADVWDEGAGSLEGWECFCFNECTCRPANPYREETP